MRELLPEAVWQRCYVRNALEERRGSQRGEQDLRRVMRWATRYPKLTDWVSARRLLLQPAASTPQASEENISSHAGGQGLPRALGCIKDAIRGSKEQKKELRTAA